MEILDQIENKVKSAIATISSLQARVKELEDEKAQYQSKLTEMLSDLQMVDDEIDEPVTAQTETVQAETAPEPSGSDTTTTFAPAAASEQSHNPVDEIEEVRSQQAVAPNQLGISSGDHHNY
ncbi:MAG: cell division protein ZapB [SAR324 cluster bacterium]|nr:cell division protein ZapB [SAR324 cluster bacterium]